MLQVCNFPPKNLYMHVTTNVALATPSINEYCMNVNVDARSGEFNS